MSPEQLFAQFMCAVFGVYAIAAPCTDLFDLARWQRRALVVIGAALIAPGAFNLYVTAVLG